MLEEFKLVGEDLYKLGLVDASAGNLSIRKDDKIYITKKGARLGHLTAADIIETGLEPGGNDKEASLELITHREIYKNTSAQAIAHAHPPYTITLSITENKIVTMDSEGQYFFPAGVPIIKVRQAIGSEEAARLLSNSFSNGFSIATIKYHGVFAINKTLIETLNLITCLENSCKIVYLTRSMPQRQTPPQTRNQHSHHKSAIPPSIGVMDRRSNRNRFRTR